MNKIKNFISTVIALCMIVTLLPAHIALATEKGDVNDYIKGRGTSISDIPSDYKGHIWQLEEAPDGVTAYDYVLTVSAYNMTASSFDTSLRYNSDDVDLVTSTGTAYTGSRPTNYVTIATATEEMTSLSDNIGGVLTDEYMIFNSTNDQLTITKETDTTYYEFFKLLCVNQDETSISASEWTTDAGAKYEKVGYSYAYTTPTNIPCKLYTLYFKLKDGKQLNSDSIILGYNESNEFHGGVGVTVANTTLATVWNDEGVFLIGFPEPEAEDQTVTFNKIQDSTMAALNGATVKIYSDAEKTQQVGDTVVVDTTGTFSVTLPAYTTYYYVVEKDQYKSEEGSFRVDASAVEIEPITLTNDFDLNVTVKDADTDEPIEGAVISIDTVSMDGTTDSEGKITVQSKTGKYTVGASKTGYTAASVSDVNVTSDNAAAVEIKLVPERISVTLPDVVDDAGASVTGAQITVEKTSANATNEWGTKNTYDAGASVSLPDNTTYKLSVTATNYSTASLYLSISNNVATLYSDSGLTTVFSEEDIAVTQVGDPYYNVVVTKEDDNVTYKVSVGLNNIDADFGTFGLRYDKDVVSLSDYGFELDAALDLFTPEDDTGVNPIAESSDDGTIGYHIFTWGGQDNSSINTLTEEKTIATYTFTLNDGKTAADISSDTFTVMPYDKTANAQTYIANNGNNEITDEFLCKLWRYVDDENTAGSLGEGRLEAEKAIDNGFYQAFALATLTSDEPGVMSDVRTVITYENFEVELAGLVFEAVDENGNAVSDAVITLYGADGTEIKKISTDATGIARTSVDVSEGDVTYTYTVNCNGYWDIPETGTASVTVKTSDPLETETVYLTMQEKVYHTPVLQNTSNTDVNASLIGDTFAYNGRDFRFNIKPDTGYVFDDTSSVTAVIDGKEYDVTFNAELNMYVVPGVNITGDKTGAADANGFPSDDIIIKIADSSIKLSDETYTVTALAGINGKVEYAGTDSENITADGTSSVIVSNISPAASTDVFTFTAEDGYKIERVIINGAEIGTYTDKTSFTYQFDNITEDCSIAVTFYDGNEPSEDSVVTLVVGDRGTVDVSSPEVETGITGERRTYIFNSAGNLVFTADADEGYELNIVEKSVNKAENEEVLSSGGTYTVAVPESSNIVVYVTFKAEGAEDTFNVFVNSYVAQGEGTISPVGILTYNKYETPEFVITASEDNWRATAVEIDNEKVSLEGQFDTITYTLPSLEKDTSIGAIFTETTYTVYGIVDLAQGGTVTTGNVSIPAKLTFTRESDGTEVIVWTNNLRKAEFEAPLSKGTWTVTVTKIGYLNYTITGFTVEPSQTIIYFGADEADPTVAKPIIPLIGNTSGKGTVVSLEDAGVVGSALRTGVSQKIADKGNVDDDSEGPTVYDMGYVKQNYGKRQTVQTYDDFKNGQ